MEATIGYIRKETFIQRLVGRKTFWGLVCTLLFIYPIYRSMNRTLPPDLPVYSSVPSFSFTSEFGKTFGSNNLKGKIYFVSFTNADYINSHPSVMKTLRVIQKRMRGVRNDASHISLATWPTLDNPKVLYGLARKFQANPFYWNFLTGESTVDFINKNFKPLMVEQNLIKENASIDDLVNLNKIVLVDRIGQVRGFYSMDKNSINTLMINVGLLINRKNQK